MKKNVILKLVAFSLLAATLVTLTACSGMKKTKGGLEYRIMKKGEGKTTAKIGDYIEGEIWVKAGDSVLLTNAGKPDIIMQVAAPEFVGDLQEGIILLHEGDSAIFNVCADSIRARGYVPELVKEKLTYIIKVNKIMDEAGYREYLQQKQILADKAFADAQVKEKGILAEYVKANNITVAPTASGLYFIEMTKGTGKQIASGSTASINYTGRLLNGKVFDSNIESVAKEAGVYTAQRPYEPMAVIVGQKRVIAGMDEALLMMRKGGKAQIIVPFALAYGAQDMGIIPSFSTLIFEMEIVEVN